ncbi:MULTISPECIES: MFS transporter [unclassified Acinetobacter]|uniref:MFS transporter n=1 Tax=unclassified Acinetobacter TaxID=196816 RepID=UPI002934E629|nr:MULTISPECIES: MFS transporter [unclassified Acinetobacter]WOE30496.1 MFS transporter [Acinetobacter sp. SAAs470]WOE38687.1 MFS transporter [Acinetobacter sp. SAAs474]
MGTQQYSVTAGIDTSIGIPRRYAWIVFALTFGLLISDYMSRQVLNAVFPLIKNEWFLSDAQLGLLSGIVALMVGLLTLPLSILADRFGKIKSLTLMAVLWSLATLGCALAQSYGHMLLARFLVGVGEAAYGSVGIAVVVAVFPRHMRATLASAFMAGGIFGSFLGMALGGVLAEYFGWRWAFAGMAIFGLILALLYPMIVKERKIGSQAKVIKVNVKQSATASALRSIYSSKSVVATYFASGLQLFVGGTIIVWLPSYLNRFYAMNTDQAGIVAAMIILTSAVGTILCGMLCDRLGRNCPERKVTLAIIYCLLGCVILLIAFAMPVGFAQLMVIALGMFIAIGTNGPSSAMVANLTHNTVHSTAFATLTLANNLLGLALGPLVVGKVSDVIGLHQAFQFVPLVSIFAAAIFFYAKRHYVHDVKRFNQQLSDQQQPHTLNSGENV